MPTILIESAKILIGNELTTAHLFLEEGVIKSISKTRPLEHAETKINAAGLIALPGLIDAHVHLRDLELSYKETFETGTQAAAAGGFTTVLDMPNTRPPTTSNSALVKKMSRAQERLYVNVGFQGALIEDPIELGEMKKSGAIAFKLYLNKSLETFDSSNDSKLERALQAAKDCNGIVTVHAEDAAAIRSVQEKRIAQGRSTIKDFLQAHTPSVEVSAVARILSLTKRFGVQAHICHITIPQSVVLVKRTPNTTCEASAHHLFLNQTVFKNEKTRAICVPPIRGERYREGLWRAFGPGKVDILASDHAPHTIEEKTTADAWKAASGVPGLETSLPVLFTEVTRGRLPLRRFIEATSTNPARIFRLRRKGVLKEGFDADVVLVDPKAKGRIRPEKFLSKAKYSPFSGRLCLGKAAYTIVNGTLIAQNGEIVGPPTGRVVSGDA